MCARVFEIPGANCRSAGKVEQDPSRKCQRARFGCCVARRGRSASIVIISRGIILSQKGRDNRSRVLRKSGSCEEDYSKEGEGCVAGGMARGPRRVRLGERSASRARPCSGPCINEKLSTAESGALHFPEGRCRVMRHPIPHLHSFHRPASLQVSAAVDGPTRNAMALSVAQPNAPNVHIVRFTSRQATAKHQPIEC